MKKRKKKGEWPRDAYIKSHLRKIWRWSPQRRETLKTKWCVICGNRSEKLYADHITPVVSPSEGFKDWNDYIERLFNGKLQALCGKCHKVKSKAEAKERSIWRKKRKLNESK